MLEIFICINMKLTRASNLGRLKYQWQQFEYWKLLIINNDMPLFEERSLLKTDHQFYLHMYADMKQSDFAMYEIIVLC